MSAGCYVRVSTSEQAEHGYSVGEQEDRLRKYCDAMNWQIYDVYIDGGFSGANTDRPALQKLIRDVQDHKIQKVVVYKLDRLSRSQKDALYLIEDVFLASGCDFVSMSENFDSSTPFGKAALGMIAVFAQLEREQIKERMSMGRLARAKEGKFHGSVYVPIGYDYKDGHMVVNDFEAAQIVKAHELYVSGLGAPAICDQLNAAGMTHKFGKWQQSTLSNVLARKTYIGYTFFNGEWYQGEHEPILSQELYDAAKRIKERKYADFMAYGTRSGTATSYLGGLLYCAWCGAKYNKCTDHRTVCYKCCSRTRKKKTQIKDEKCMNKNWKMAELDALIFAEIEKLSLDGDFIAGNEKIDSRRSEADILALEIDKLDSQLLRLMDLYSVGSVPLDILQKKTDEIQEQKNLLAEKVKSIEMTNVNAKIRRDSVKKVKSFAEVLKRGNLDEIRGLLFSLISRIEIDGEDIQIYWRFS